MKLPTSTQNWISLIGATIALISLFMIIFLFSVTLILGAHGTYIGLIIYILLPSFLVLGLLLIPIGMATKAKQLKMDKKLPLTEWPKLDLNNQAHRNAFLIFSIGSAVFLFLSAIGSYEAFHFTESVQFCGRLCHNVMKPEYVAYQHSSHARVACVDCHVGSGADWYVQSKLSGLYQVYAVLANVYPRPIETPIANLRPARETCEECHWPQKFYSNKLRTERHYLNDEENTEWDIHLNMKIGPQYSAHGQKEGIHWHINSDVKIEYIPADKTLQEILWIKYKNIKNGKTIIYTDEDNPVEEGGLDSTLVRTMDCMDCHNRPSHNYRPPAFFVNEAITAGDIPITLPEIKAQAMEICGEEFSSTDSAFRYIETTLNDYYTSNYTEIIEKNPETLEQAIEALKQVYSINIFPEMKVRWDAYPNHIGHVEFNGCFRCHNDTFKDEKGDRVIFKDCNQCHTIVAQGRPSDIESAEFGQTLEFEHPVDIDDAWKESLCTDCHTGLNP